MGQTANVIFRADKSPHALARLSTRTISGSGRRKPASLPPQTRRKANGEKRDRFTPGRHRDEVPLKARAVSVYQALEATKGAAEGVMAAKKVESVKIGLSYDLGDGRPNRVGRRSRE